MSALRVGHLLVSDNSGSNDQYLVEHSAEGLSIQNRSGSNTSLILRSASDPTQYMSLTHDTISATNLNIDSDLTLNNGIIAGSTQIEFKTPDTVALLNNAGQFTLVPGQSYDYQPFSSPAGTILNIPDVTFTDTTSVSNAFNFVAARLGVPTLTSSNALVTDVAATLEIAGAPTGSNTSINHAYALLVSSGLVKIQDDLAVRDITARNIGSSGVSTFTQAVFGKNTMSASTWQRGFLANVVGSQFTDSTTIGGTTLSEMNSVFIGRSTLNATNSGVTATNASSLTIEGAPSAGNGYTIGTAYALRVLNGLSSVQDLQANGVLTVSGNASVGGSLTSGVISIQAPADQGSCLKMRPHSDNTESSIGWFGTASATDSPWKIGVVSGNLSVWNGSASPVVSWTTSGVQSSNISVTGDLSVSGTSRIATLKTSSIGMADSTTRLNITPQMYIDSSSGVNIDAALTVTNGLSLNSKRIQALGEPQVPTDAATMAYVNSKIQGLSVKGSVDTTAGANVNLATDLAVGATIGGVTLVAGDRVLIMRQTNPVENGIYVAGTPATRAADLAIGASTGGVFVFDENTGAGYLNASDGIIGTDAVSFSQFNGAASFITGSALARSGNTISVVYDGTSIDVANNQLRIGAGAAGTGLSGGAGSPLSVKASQPQITAVGTLTGGTWNADVIGVPYGGTGVNALSSGQLLVGNGTNAVQTSSYLTFDSTAKLLTVNNASVGTVSVTSGNQLGLGSNTLNGTSTSALTVAGDIQLTNVTRQSIVFNNAGYAAPTTTSRSIGSKLILLPSVSATAVDFGVGIGTSPAYVNTPSALWYSTSNAGYEHQFWNGTTKSLSISSSSTILSSGTLVIGSNTPDGSIPVEVQRGLASGKDMVRIQNTTPSGSSSIVFQDSGNTGRLRAGVESGVGFVQSVNTSLALDSANVLVNTRTASSYALDVSGSTRVSGPLLVTGQFIGLPSLARTAMNALTAQTGAMVYGTDDASVQVYDGSAWRGVGENSLSTTNLTVAASNRVNVTSASVPSAKIIRTSTRTSVFCTVTVSPASGMNTCEVRVNVPNLPAGFSPYDLYIQSNGYIESSFERIENMVVAGVTADGNIRCRFTAADTGVHVLQLNIVF